MISVERLTAELLAERTRFGRFELRTDYVMGIIQGLTIAIMISKALWENTNRKFIRNNIGRPRNEHAAYKTSIRPKI